MTLAKAWNEAINKAIDYIKSLAMDAETKSSMINELVGKKK